MKGWLIAALFAAFIAAAVGRFRTSDARPGHTRAAAASSGIVGDKLA